MKRRGILTLVGTLVFMSVQFTCSVISANAVEVVEVTTSKLEEKFADNIMVSSKVYDGAKIASLNFSNVHLEGDNTTAQTLNSDKNEPSVNDMKITYNDTKKQVEAKGFIVDAESGIRSIEFKWDNDEWKEYTVQSNESNVPILFEDIVPYCELETVNENNGLHTLYFRIIDNAGNEHVEDGVYCSLDNGPDQKEPQITDVRFETFDTTPLKTALRIFTFGNYTNQALQLTIIAEDTSYSGKISGIEYVAICDGMGNNAREIYHIDGVKDEYCFTLDPQTIPSPIVENFYIRVSDGNNVLEIPFLEVLKTYETKNLMEVGGTTIDSAVDWNSVESNRWVFDNQSPQIVPDYSNVFQIKNAYCYGDAGGEFSITITDEGGLETFEITQNHKQSQMDGGTDTSITVDECIDIESGYVYFIDTNELETGLYTYTVLAKDYAGNPTTEKVFQFYVDHEKPEGHIEVISPICVEIDGKQWIKEKDSEGNYQNVTFRVYAKSSGAKLYTITTKVNGEEIQTFTTDNFIVDPDTNETYIDLTINTNDFMTKSDHTYVVTADVLTETGNAIEAKYILYVDKENPVVNSFTVDTKNDAAADRLNVLTYGVYASDSLIFSVDVSDARFDSGVDYVTIMHDGLTTPVKMERESEGKYYAYLDIDTQIFQSDIVVTVYDRMGKTNVSCSHITNADKTDEVSDSCYVMLETIKPFIIIDLPEADSIGRDDGQVWYRQHNNSKTDQEKMFTLKVQDKDSGIRNVELTINGIIVTPEMEIDGKALPTIEATSKDEEANCELLQYSYSLEKIAEKIPENEDGSYVIEVTVVDNAGNINSNPIDSEGNNYDDSRPIYYRDTEKPSVSKFIFNLPTSENITEVNKFVEHLEYGLYFKTGFDVVVSIVDEGASSQLDKALFRIVPYQDGVEQESEFHEADIVDGKASYTVPAGFKGQIYVQAYDKVGNISDEKTPQGVVVDDIGPVITVEELPDTSMQTDEKGNRLYSETVQFRVTISDTKSGLKEISYSKSSEKDSHDAVVNIIQNADGYLGNTVLDNGWKITKTDVNLITEVSKVFVFDSDDNDIIMTFKAMDRAGNIGETANSEAFTIDTISPEVSITNATELINDMYYSGSTSFTITVTERNFDEGLMVATIVNEFTDSIPSVSFQTSDSNPNVHIATVTFEEGDYKFSFAGEDRAGYTANISYNGDNKSNNFYAMFNVDSTAPSIKNNFRSFGEDTDTGIYYNSEQIAIIEVVEHNFHAEDMGISVQSKGPGTKHSFDDEGWYDISYYNDWIQNGDIYTLKIPFSNDGVYRISISPKDRAGNEGVLESGALDHTPIYEIDTTIPVVVARNEQSVDNMNTQFIDVYDFERRNDELPTVEFDDINFDHLEYSIISYTPVYVEGKELDIIKPNEKLNHIQTQKVFTLSDFEADGVYAVTITAYDKAGNASVLNENTYMRMINSDVLAYIENSSSERKTGWYSFADERGPISKRPNSFSDLSIIVISKSDYESQIVLRNENEEEIDTGITAKCIEDIYGVGLFRYTLPGTYFADAYAEDTDTRLYLKVNNAGRYVELGEIYIDNTQPTCDIPNEFKDWGCIWGSGSQTIVFSNVSELLDKENSIAYVDGKEVPLEFSEDDKSVSLTLESGSYSVGISLVDRAGNIYNITEVKHLAVGYTRLWLGLSVCAGGILLSIITMKGLKLIYRKK